MPWALGLRVRGRRFSQRPGQGTAGQQTALQEQEQHSQALRDLSELTPNHNYGYQAGGLRLGFKNGNSN